MCWRSLSVCPKKTVPALLLVFFVESSYRSVNRIERSGMRVKKQWFQAVDVGIIQIFQTSPSLLIHKPMFLAKSDDVQDISFQGETKGHTSKVAVVGDTFFCLRLIIITSSRLEVASYSLVICSA